MRCFVSRNTSLLVRAFVTYVRPLLEYNCIIWSPSLNRDIELTEQAQRRFTRRLSLRHCLYDKRLNLLKLQKLESRRLKQELIWCYKILFGYVNTKHRLNIAFFSYMSHLLEGTHINYINFTTLLMSELVSSQKGLLIYGINYLLILMISRVCLPIRK